MLISSEAEGATPWDLIKYLLVLFKTELLRLETARVVLVDSQNLSGFEFVLACLFLVQDLSSQQYSGAQFFQVCWAAHFSAVFHQH